MALDPEDGLVVAEVGDWAEDKYLHVEHYARMFAQSMKGKWGSLAYLELFSGPGRAVVAGTGRIIDTAPLRSVGLTPGFDVHVYGELDGSLLRALEERCTRRRPDAKCFFVEGDVNETWPRLRDCVRRGAGGGTCLTFGFIDPFKCSNLAFATLRGLSDLLNDVLVLVPSYMDAHRNWKLYLDEDKEVLDTFLGDRAWRDAWAERAEPKERFARFVIDQLGRRMADLGFHYDGPVDMKLIRSTNRNLRLYHLAFFSRHELGMKLWRQAMKSSNPQRRLF